MERDESFKRAALQWIRNMNYTIIYDDISWNGNYYSVKVRINSSSSGYKTIDFQKSGVPGYVCGNVIINVGKPIEKTDSFGWKLYSMSQKYPGDIDYTWEGSDVVIVIGQNDVKSWPSFFDKMTMIMDRSESDIQELVDLCD